MSSASSGFFTPTTVSQGDANIGINSFAINIDNAANAGAGLAGALTSTYTGVTVFNRSTSASLKVVLTLGNGQTAVAGDFSFLVPPNGVYSFTGEPDAITGYAVQYVATPALVSGIVDVDALAAAALAGIHQSVLTFANT